jgi:glycosyltransferase involved in cell wall biosynthesis/GT2 family glycosyltransferase
MRVALIQSEARLDRNAFSVARALRELGHEATFVTPSLAAAAQSPAREFPVDAGLAAARALSGVVAAFDVAWFFERHWAMPTLRERRFRDRLLPLVVLDMKPDPEPIPASLEEINRANSRQYSLRWADAVVSGETSEAEESARRVEELWRERQAAPARAIRRPSTSPAVTVCIPYFEAPEFLPEALQSLERQTSNDFTVVAVDDGSSTPDGLSVFDACAERYASRGWTFLRQTNLYPGAARNRAAREATTEFLLFLDADDIAMPTMVERFLRAALLTDDDCLVVPNYGFRDDPEGPCALLYDPPGNSLIGSMGDDMHGGSCIFVRRESFWSIGGFTEIRGMGFEDYEFHVRCNLRGLRWDVLPEWIYRYRMPRAGNVSRSTARYANQATVLALYEQRLRASGLGQLPLAFASAFQRHERASAEAGHLRNSMAARLPKSSSTPRKLRLLLLTCHFPFGIVSGWHRRVQEMIRHFGSRYELTLVTSMSRKENALESKETFRYLKAIRGVEGSLKSAAGNDLPFRVRKHYTETFRAALQSLPTNQYDAALIDQIFMAECRHDIETVTVLTEHNIESQLLRQAAGHLWKDTLPEDWQNPLLEAALLERYENCAWPDFPLRAVCSEVDRAQMDGRAKRGNTVVAPNGADPSIWLPDVRHGAATVLFPAHLAYPPNVDGVEFLLAQIWPRVRKRKSGARLILAGRDPSSGVQAAAAAAPGVELCVNPKSMQRVARRASITVVPLRLGSGTRYKILESMAWGLPVVTTARGAEGIEAADGEHLLIRDDPDEFAEAIARLMSDEALWRKLRGAGRELVRERYCWDRVFQPLDDALVELVG